MADRVLILGVDGLGSPCAREPLEHGADPYDVLAGAGWELLHLVSIDDAEEGIALVFRVRRCRPGHRSVPKPRLTVPPHLAATAVRHQRVAAYVVVESGRGVLLTEYSDQTARPGSWGLPGGGLDPGEHPDHAVMREVWEETGQPIVLDAPWKVMTDHWVGTAPNGLVEDFHAVRLIYRGHCPNPTDPVVHDIGGTTRSAAWCGRSGLARLDIIPWTRALLNEPGG